VTRPGTGGLPPQRPDQQPLPPAAAVSPGAAAGIFRGRQVVIVGPGAGSGLFVYSGTPVLGNPPVLAITAPGTTTDPYGNPVVPVLLIGPAAGPGLQADDAGDLNLLGGSGGGDIYISPGLELIGFYPSGLADQPALTLANAPGIDPDGHTFTGGLATYDASGNLLTVLSPADGLIVQDAGGVVQAQLLAGIITVSQAGFPGVAIGPVEIVTGPIIINGQTGVITADTGWHSLGTPAGTTLTQAQYRMQPDGTVLMQLIEVNVTTPAATVTFPNALPATYCPLYLTREPLSQQNAAGAVGHASVNTAGTVQLVGLGGANLSGQYDLTFAYPVI
jgi:hypothetical protein